ncbi:ER membrane protein DP1/Yop1 [Blyttiomyces sp. JEL0837]|nr:ER membrane protein DP1/Yop1 [Blyttiomyces sp. JEL0837]
MGRLLYCERTRSGLTDGLEGWRRASDRSIKRGGVVIYGFALAFVLAAWGYPTTQAPATYISTPYYLAQFDKELSKYPVAIEVEKRTNVPKTYIFGGIISLFGLLIFFNIWGDLLTNILGFVWPAYQSFKAIESNEKSDDVQWLTYWTVFGFLNILEFFADYVLYWVPFYYSLKTILILYLILPQFNGAAYIYQAFLRPYLLTEEKKIDSGLDKIKAKASAAVQQLEADLHKKE